MQDIKNQIKQGKIKLALENMIARLDNNSEYKNQLYLLLAQYSNLERDIRLGIIDKENERLVINKIIKAMLGIIDEEHSTSSSTQLSSISISHIPKNMIIFLIILGLCLILFLLKTNITGIEGNSNSNNSVIITPK